MKYAKENGYKGQDIYELFVQESNGTLVLSRQFTEDGELNPNYQKIQSTPELKRFYDFFQTKIKENNEGLPVTLSSHFIPNLPKGSLKNTVKSLNPVHERTIGENNITQEYLSDVIPIKFYNNIPASVVGSPVGALVVTTGSGLTALSGTITTIPKGLMQGTAASGAFTYYMDALPGSSLAGSVWRISRRGSETCPLSLV